MIDHVSFAVNNFKDSIDFYDTTLACLGVERIMTFEEKEYSVAGYGANGKPFFWISVETNPNLQEFVGKSRGFHVAFLAPSVEAIENWYNTCLKKGGKDNGKPGTRPHYHPGFYGAFIVDPNGYRIEAALHNYEAEKGKNWSPAL